MWGYDSNAGAYEAGRPSYPTEAVEHLIEVLDIDSTSSVLDLAAGTGKLTRRLIERAGSVTAVEPVAGMRRQLMEQVPAALVLEGRAEEIPVESHSMDAVTVAQAFHWFDGSRALAEIARVLRSGGSLGLIWNVRDLGTPEHAVIEEVLDRYRESKPNFRSGLWREAFSRHAGFTPLRDARFGYQRHLSPSLTVDLVRSYSYMGALEDEHWDQLATELLRSFEDLADIDGMVELTYVTHVFWTRLEAGDGSGVREK